MRPRTLVILVVLGTVAVAGGWYFGVATAPHEQTSVDAGKLMFPDLAAKLQKAERIEVVHQGKPLIIELKNSHWGLADRGGYPVQEIKLRSMLTALTELRLVEQRTADPTQYAALGVEDPNAKDSNSNLLRVLDGSGQPIAALIAGHRRVRTQGNVPDQVYVRRPGQPQSWLAEGSLEVDADPQLWLDRDVMNIDHSRIAKVSVSRVGETLEFARKDNKLELEAPAEHAKLEDYKLEDVSRALELLTLQDVRPDDGSPGNAVGQSVFTTTDGLTVTASIFQPPKDAAKPDSGKEIAARFAVAGQDKAKPEAERLSARVSGWTYSLGDWKEKALTPTLQDLLAAQPASPAKVSGPASTDEPEPAAKP